MKIYILGANGMLGRYVSKYLGQYFKTIEVNRDKIDASSVSQNSLNSKLYHLGIEPDDVVINCVGTIKPRVHELGDTNAILVNSVFPRLLANTCDMYGAFMIHPTTDCVYSGLKGAYTESDKYDVSDVYGMSKAMGEPSNCTIIRTSIIGEEVNQKRSLVEWVKSNANNMVFGFTNHYWNGVTCLQFAKICHEIIKKQLFWNGVKHVYSNTLNKKELIETISEVYGLNVKVTPKETVTMCDRTLSTNQPPMFTIPTLKEQIIEMRDFYEKLKM